MNKQNFEKAIQKYSQNVDYQKEWYIIYSENTNQHHHCICGHNVKRITYIYNKNTKHIMQVGTTCVKKSGIKQHLKNCILVLTIKNILEKKEYTKNLENSIVISSFYTILHNAIQTTFTDFKIKINFCIQNNMDIDYYDIVAPFRRLLNDVCYLVTEYNYDFMVLLKEIENTVNEMNTTVKHIIIDETKDDISEESLSESSEDSDPAFHIIENILHQDNEDEDEDENIVQHIHINNENVDIDIDADFDNIFICNYCDTSFFTKDEKEQHENICIDNHSIISSEPNIYDLEIDDMNDIYDNESLYTLKSDTYNNSKTNITSCFFCVNTYCYCIIKFRLYNLRLGVKELKKDISNLSNNTSILLHEISKLKTSIL